MAGKVQDPELEDQELDVEVEDVQEGASLPFFEKYRTPLIAGGVAVVALILGLIGYQWYLGQQNDKANSEMFRAITAFEADSVEKAMAGSGSFIGLEEMADDFSGTVAADQANYYLGVGYLKGDSANVDLAIEYLEKVDASGNTLAMSRDIALAFAYERKDDLKKAASLFKKAAYTPSANDQTTPYLLMEAGRCYEMAGQPGDALDVYETIKSDFPKSTEALSIDKFIGRVSP